MLTAFLVVSSSVTFEETRTAATRLDRLPGLPGLGNNSKLAGLGKGSGSKPDVLASYGRLPLHFEPNVEQTDARVRFLARGDGMTAFFTDTETVMVLGRSEQAVLRMKLAGAGQPRRVSGLGKLPGMSNYFLGNDPKKWRTNIPHYARIQYEGVYPGIDLVWYGNQRQLEYDFVVAAGADPKQIQVAYEGVESVGIEANGELVLRTALGEVRQQQPRVYQEIGGKRVEVKARYALVARNRVSFQLAKYDRRRELCIDPVVLVYSTYLGGSGDERGYGIAVDGAGSAYLTGYTTSTNFPTGSAYQPTYQGGSYDVFVTKLSPDGDELSYSTYLGGSAWDAGFGIAVDGIGSAYVTGYTQSANFPTQSAYQATLQGTSDAFVTKLTPAGNALVYSTYLGGGSDTDVGCAIAVDGAGSAHITGYTQSTNFPVQSAYQATLQGSSDAFATKLSPAGTALVYSTYLGGSGGDYGEGIAVDAAGSAYVTGYTSSTDFPIQSAYETTNRGGSADAFITKLAPAGDALVYSTYLGGSGYDAGLGIAVDGAGSAYVTGFTTSTTFPTQSAYQATSQGAPYDAFVTKLTPAGNALSYSTYLGGNGYDAAVGIAVDGAGSAYVTGITTSTNFPTQSPLQATSQGGYDAFVTKLTPAGDALSYSTYLGGSDHEYGRGIAVNAAGSAYVTGYTGSVNFPTHSAYQATHRGGTYDVFVTKLSAYRAPTSAFRDADGAVRLLQFGAVNTDNAGGVFAGNPGAAQSAVGDTFVVNRDTYNALWANVFNVSTQTWGSWAYGGGATQGDPAIAIATNGTAYIAARDTWNSYWITSYTPASGFGTWTYLAGIFSTDPVMAAASDGSVYIVGKDNWNSLWSGRYIPASGFQGWHYGGGIVKGKPSVAVGTDDVAYIAARDNWDSLWMARVQGNSWLGWRYGGGVMSGDPQVASSGGTTYAVLADPGQVIWYIGYTSSGWQNWVSTGGVLQDASPAALVGELYIVGRDSNNDLWWYRMQGNQWTYSGQNGLAAGTLAASPR